jgi:hypothetical protein
MTATAADIAATYFHAWIAKDYQITSDITIRKRFVDGQDVLTWFDLHTTIAPPVAVANWSRVEDGKVTRIAVAFDPREIIAGSAPRQ